MSGDLRLPPSPAELKQMLKAERERCAKVLDEMAEKAKHDAAGRDDTESVIVVLEIAAARIRALPEVEGK